MPLDAAEDGEHRLVLAVDRRRDARRERAQLLRVLQTTRFVLETRVLALDEFRFVDLLRDVTQIVGAPLGFRLATLRDRRSRAAQSASSS